MPGNKIGDELCQSSRFVASPPWSATRDGAFAESVLQAYGHQRRECIICIYVNTFLDHGTQYCWMNTTLESEFVYMARGCCFSDSRYSLLDRIGAVRLTRVICWVTLTKIKLLCHWQIAYGQLEDIAITAWCCLVFRPISKRLYFGFGFVQRAEH